MQRLRAAQHEVPTERGQSGKAPRSRCRPGLNIRSGRHSLCGMCDQYTALWETRCRGRLPPRWRDHSPGVRVWSHNRRPRCARSPGFAERPAYPASLAARKWKRIANPHLETKFETGSPASANIVLEEPTAAAAANYTNAMREEARQQCHRQPSPPTLKEYAKASAFAMHTLRAESPLEGAPLPAPERCRRQIPNPEMPWRDPRAERAGRRAASCAAANQRK